jgi:hypothetical protein
MGAEFTEDAVLGGKLLLKQPRRGHRFGHDALLLAAACPARARERESERRGWRLRSALTAPRSRWSRSILILPRLRWRMRE